MSSSGIPTHILRDNDAQERQKIDAEIRRLQERIRSLRTARNHLTPVSRIPPEILIRIFSHLQGQWDGKAEFPDHFMRWFVVARVWTLWRYVALGSPHLWTTFPLRNAGYIRAALGRSKSIPLLIGDVSKDNIGLTLEFLRDLSRIRCLRISPVEASTWGDIDAGCRILTQPAPILESFSTDVGVGCPRNLPSPLFNGSAPRLQHLSIVNCSFNYADISFPSITTLQIQNPHHRIRPHDFVDILRKMHNLEDVMLSNAFFGLDAQPIHGVPVHHMPRVRQFHLEDDRFGPSEILFSYISFPVAARIHFGSFGGTEMGEHNFPITLQSIIQATQLHNSGIRKMLFDCRDSFRLKLWTSKNKADEPILSIHFRGQQGYSSHAEDWFKACQHLPLQCVESLSVKALIEQQAWGRALSDYTKLSHLTVQGISGRHFLRYLIHNYLSYRPTSIPYGVPVTPNSVARHVVLATLKSLELRSVSLAGIDLGDLRSMFVTRQQRGACLQLLVMRPLSEFSALLEERLRGSRIRVRLEDDSHRRFTRRASVGVYTKRDSQQSRVGSS